MMRKVFLTSIIILCLILVSGVNANSTSSFTSTNISITTNISTQSWEGYVPFTIRFINTSIGNNQTSYIWSYVVDNSILNSTFGTSSNIVYTFTNASNYSIKLIAYNNTGGFISSQSTWVNVSDRPYSNWVSNNGCWTKTNGYKNLRMWNTTGISSWNISNITDNSTITFFILAGGGGGGSQSVSHYDPGGGGAGGYILRDIEKSKINSTIIMNIGMGGLKNQNGTNSSIIINATTNLSALGGGRGGNYNNGFSSSGGCGGGGYGYNAPGVGYQGYSGSYGHGDNGIGGGGGGIGSIGGYNALSSTDRLLADGGKGLILWGTGYGGGGAGCSRYGDFNATSGGGLENTNGTNGLGGGGGAGCNSGVDTGGSGGSGTIILSYPNNDIQLLSSFYVNNTKGINPLSVQFNSTSEGNISSWNWSYITDININTIIFSYDVNPSYIFNTGNYLVSLNVSNLSGYNLSSKWINITSDVGPYVTYTNTSSNPIDDKNISFTGSFSLDSSYINSWIWNFGDGNSSILINPLYSYPHDGSYTTILTFTTIGGGGKTYSLSKLINIPQNIFKNNITFFNQSQIPLLYNDSLKIYGTASSPGCITAMDHPELGGWIGLSTAEPMIYHQQVTTNPGSAGFGSQYSGSANFGVGNDIATSDGATFSTEGRGLYADIYLLDGTRKGTYTTGGTVRSVDVAVKNGLWSVSGGDDGKLYIYSKDATSAWYVFYQGDSDVPIISTAMSWRGEYVADGRTDGKLEYFSTSNVSTASSSYLVNVFVSKGGMPYIGAPMSISGATTSVGTTDSYGKFSFTANDLSNYVINVNSGEKIFTYQATSSYTTVTINIPTALVTRPYQYAASFNDTTHIITTSYDDVNIADINVTVTDITNNTIIHMADYHSTTMTDQVLGDETHEYRINLKFVRTTGTTYQDTLYAKTSIFGKVTHTPDQWKLFEYALYCIFLMFVALAIGSTSPKYGVIVIPALVVLGVGMGFLPMSIWLVPLGLSIFIAMTEVLRRRSD